MKILVTRRLPGTYVTALIDHYDEVTVLENERPLTTEELKKGLEDKMAVICMLTDKMNSETIADSIRCIITYSVGVDHIDLDYCRQKKIIVCHTPHILTDATADCAWALMLSCGRRLKPAAEYVEAGKFDGYGPELFLGTSVSRGTLGIVGMGRIGTAVAQRAMGFGMNILYTDARALPKDIETLLAARKVELDELLGRSDIVSIHTPLLPETTGLIGVEQLGLMKDNAVLINTSRGPVIDERALAAHLKSHPDFWVGLDVYEKEPEVTPELLRLPNAICLPHIASADTLIRKKMAQMVVAEAIRYINGDDLQLEFKPA